MPHTLGVVARAFVFIGIDSLEAMERLIEFSTHHWYYLVALAATLAYAALLFVLADQLLENKDLLWTE